MNNIPIASSAPRTTGSVLFRRYPLFVHLNSPPKKTLTHPNWSFSIPNTFGGLKTERPRGWGGEKKQSRRAAAAAGGSDTAETPPRAPPTSKVGLDLFLPSRLPRAKKGDSASGFFWIPNLKEPDPESPPKKGETRSGIHGLQAGFV